MIKYFEWFGKVVAWFFLSLVAPFVVALVLPFVDKTGRLPYYLRWFETPDALGWDEMLYEPSLAKIKNKYLRLFIWLGLRNRALGFQYWAGYEYPLRIDSYQGLKKSSDFWRYDYYGWCYFGAGWKSHIASGEPMIVVPFITLRRNEMKIQK